MKDGANLAVNFVAVAIREAVSNATRVSRIKDGVLPL